MALFPPGKGGGAEVAHGYKGKGVTLHSLVDGQGMPLAVISTAANACEVHQVLPLLDSFVVTKGRWGTPRKRPAYLQADAGYDSQELRRSLRQRGIQPLIVVNPRRRKRPKRGRRFAKPVDRWKGERTFAWYQRKYRRLVARWERKPRYWHAFVLFAICLMWLNKLVLVG